MYTQTTQGIKITAVPQFLPDQSEPSGGKFVWAYTIYMENEGTITVRLLNRYWRITDGFGRSHEVRGPGVVGEHPVLKPGQAFRYTSGVPLPTPSGIMVGEYEMVSEQGETILVAVPAFSLESPYGVDKPN